MQKRWLTNQVKDRCSYCPRTRHRYDGALCWHVCMPEVIGGKSDGCDLNLSKGIHACACLMKAGTSSLQQGLCIREVTQEAWARKSTQSQATTSQKQGSI